jgi:hypothetical protein
MDIVLPPLEQQVAPAPWLVARSNVDVPRLIRRALTQQPDASVDDIVQQLSSWGVQVSGVIVSMWMTRLRDQEVMAIAAQTSSEALTSAETYCTCSDEPCSCGKANQPAWWHQYCCGVHVTKQQIKERDKFFEHAAT